MKLIAGTTKLLGVIGDPVEHSLSPIMHNAVLTERSATASSLTLEYVYLPLPIKSGDLAIALAGLQAIGVRGFNVTIPHKQAILPLLTQITPIAQAVGAVNTVWSTDQGWRGTNTDVEGFIAPLLPLDRDWSSTAALVLGCGGAARAVVAGCSQLGCGSIAVVGRNPEKLQQFSQSWQDCAIAVSVQVYPWQSYRNCCPRLACWSIPPRWGCCLRLTNLL